MQKYYTSLIVLFMIFAAGCSFESDVYEQLVPGVRCESAQIDTSVGDEHAMIRCWLNSRPDADVNFIPSLAEESVAILPEYVTISPAYWDSEIRFYVICLEDDEQADISLKVESTDGSYYGTKLKDIHVSCGEIGKQDKQMDKQ